MLEDDRKDRGAAVDAAGGIEGVVQSAVTESTKSLADELRDTPAERVVVGGEIAGDDDVAVGADSDGINGGSKFHAWFRRKITFHIAVRPQACKAGSINSGAEVKFLIIKNI